MDLTQQQAKVDALKTKLSTDEAAVSADTTELTAAEAELAQGALINQLEALTTDEITTINAGLLADGSKVSVVVAP